MEFRILAGMSGMDKGAILDKIRSRLSDLKRNGRTIKIGVADVESKLVDQCPNTADYYYRDDKKDPRFSIISQVPQDEARKLWRGAFKAAVEEATRDGPDLAILLACLTYYRDETYEFYCPVDLKFVADLVVSKKMPKLGGILTLIDDIYDVYYRLSLDGHVFSIRRLVETHLPKDLPSEAARYREAMGLVVQSLIRVLEWRESEIQSAYALAAALGTTAFTLAVKHPIETGARLLLGDAGTQFGLGRTFPVYVSHPISVPRQQEAQVGHWPSFVAELQEFVQLVSEGAPDGFSVVPIMPTAIDEFRLLSDGKALLPKLASRWPIPGKTEELLYCAADPHDSYDEYEQCCLQKIFDPPVDGNGRRAGLPNADDRVNGMIRGDPKVSGMLKTLELVIRLQMANRDHLLVRQCPGLLLYRPTAMGGRFTGGVRSEIREHHRLRRFVVPVNKWGRPLVAVHSGADLKQMYQKRPDERNGFVRDAKHSLLRAAEDILKPRGLRPGGVPDDLVSDLMGSPGEPDVKPLHESLFPAESGAIGTVDSISVDVAQEGLVSAVIEERTRQLVHARPPEGWVWQYLSIDKNGGRLYERTNAVGTEDIPVILACVVDALEESQGQRNAAAKLTSEHFASRMSKEADPQSGEKPGESTEVPNAH